MSWGSKESLGPQIWHVTVADIGEDLSVLFQN